MPPTPDSPGFARVRALGLALLVLGGSTFFWLRGRSRMTERGARLEQEAVPPARLELEKPALPAETLVRTIEQQEVFRRALWRRPSREDTVHNAERREWADAGGVTRWEWFLSITPGPTLEAWLNTNPFSLRRVEQLSEKDAAIGEDPPEWFPRVLDGMELSQSPTGSFWVARSPDSKRIVLSDRGAGLTRPVAQPK